MRYPSPHPLTMASPTAPPSYQHASQQHHRVGQRAGGFNLLSLQNLGRAEEGDGARENGELDAAENLLDVKIIHVCQMHFWGLGPHESIASIIMCIIYTIYVVWFTFVLQHRHCR